MKPYAFPRLLAMLLLLSVPLWMDSCKKDDDPNPASPAGNWKLNAITVNPPLSVSTSTGTITITDLVAATRAAGDKCADDAIVTFNTNGNLSANRPTTCQTSNLYDFINLFNGATWTQKGSTMTIIYSDGTKEDFAYTLNDNTLQLVSSEGNLNGVVSTITIELKRQ